MADLPVGEIIKNITDDVKLLVQDQIELDIRLALDGLRSAEEQVKVAEEGLSLADNELSQARRRYDAGVTTGLEVTDAQTRLERARDNRIAALFNHNLARIDFGTARRDAIIPAPAAAGRRSESLPPVEIVP